VYFNDLPDLFEYFLVEADVGRSGRVVHPASGVRLDSAASDVGGTDAFHRSTSRDWPCPSCRRCLMPVARRCWCNHCETTSINVAAADDRRIRSSVHQRWSEVTLAVTSELNGSRFFCLCALAAFTSLISHRRRCCVTQIFDCCQRVNRRTYSACQAI